MAQTAPRPSQSFRSSRQDTSRRIDLSGPLSAFWAVVAILVFAVAFGGGGSKYAMANLVVQLAALVALSFHRAAFNQFWQNAQLSLRALIVLSLLVPALYLIPLPPGLWTQLPGRELVADSFELLRVSSWASASVDPIRSALALTALISPLAVLTIGWIAPPERLVLVGWIVVAMGLVNVLIGVPQVLSNSDFGVIYPENPMPGVLFGTFANRNSTGLFLVAALTLAVLLPAPLRFGRIAMPLRLAACTLIVVAIFLTQSRTALVLALIPITLAALRFASTRFAAKRADLSRLGWLTLASIVLGIVVIGGFIAASPGRLGDTLERFGEADGDSRAYIWEDAVYSAGRYWPVGAGIGTFDEVFQIDESLENMTLRRAGRAHNDYIEIAIEAGAPGLVLVAAWTALLAWLSWRARLSHDRWIAWSGATILLIIALQSITDYPLRNQTMLALAGYALLVLARFGLAARKEQER